MLQYSQDLARWQYKTQKISLDGSAKHNGPQQSILTATSLHAALHMLYQVSSSASLAVSLPVSNRGFDLQLCGCRTSKGHQSTAVSQKT